MNKQILVSLLVIGVVGAVASGTTLAEFTDTESSTGNTFTAGSLDLLIDWNQTYNGPSEFSNAENSTARNCSPVTDGDEVIGATCVMFDLGDIKPGDMGEATVSMHLIDNPGYIWTRFNVYNDFDNGCNEPESNEGGDLTCTDDVDGDGELAENMLITIWVDDANNEDDILPGNNRYDDGERVLFNDTADVLDLEEIMLDSDSSTQENEAFPGGDDVGYIAIKWELPYDTGNIVQSDSMMMDVDFAAQQERHTADNGGPMSPFN